MSEKKRFILAEDSNGLFSIFDNEDPEDEPLIYGARFGTEKLVDLLNKQLLFSERLALEKEFYEWCETALENGDNNE